jgi:beta-lactam-binding protein with PASTA domain
MGVTRGCVCALLCVGLAWAGDNKEKPVSNKPGDKPPVKSAQIDIAASPAGKPRLDFTRVPLSFEPNLGQSDPSARFIAKSPGYILQLEPAGARFQFRGRDKAGASLRMDLEKANRQAAITGESPLPGKANYFPASDPKSWITNVPTYSQVHYQGIYPGVDAAFYGSANRLEYDFLIQPGADPDQIRMKLSGSGSPSINSGGDLVLGDLSFLKPVVYQMASDGKTRELVDARYQIERDVVTFALGKYDHHRQLVIDPTVALSESQYLAYPNVAAVTVDSSGNSYVTGTAQGSGGYGYYVTKFNSSGTVVYTASLGTNYYTYPVSIAVGSTGEAYVAGTVYTAYGATVPTSTNAYQSTSAAYYSAFLTVLSTAGSAVSYGTYLSGTAATYNYAQGVAVDSSGDAYLTGYTYDSTFPTTSGAYQTTLAGSYDGFVSKFNPSATTAKASLVYSTLLGLGNTQLFAIAVDSSGDAYVTGYGYLPVTSGAFQYTGLYTSDDGVYVTKLNPTATALLYSAYLGYGTGYGIAVDTSPSAYVTGTVSGADFPTTPGAYQTSYAGGFVTKLSTTGATEVYSTFLGGPSSYSGGNSVLPVSLTLPYGCASSCNAYVAGQTTTTDFPLIDAIDTTPSTTGYSGFVTEIAATGASALFSSYLNGVTSGVYGGGGSNNISVGDTPAIAVDSSGNMSVVAAIYGTSDFPITISNSNPADAFLARIVPATLPFTIASPTTVSFGTQPVGVSTSIYNGAPAVRLSNYSSAAATLSSIVVSPSSVFSESDNCSGSVPAGGYCTLTLNFTPNAPSTWTGTVTITSNASNSPTTITLTGTGSNTAFVEPSQSSLTFGNQGVGTSSTAQSVTITNLGNQTTALNIYVSTSNFSTLNNCPSELLPGASCTATVTFSPTQAGLLTDTLTIYSSVGPNASVPLSGTGTITGGTSAVTLSGTSLQFGPQVVSTTSSYQAIYLTNNGAVPIVIQSAAVSGPFTLYNYCWNTLPYQLNPQSSCYLYVTFSPTTTGALTGTLTITDSATGSPQTVALSGTGLASTENVEFYPSSSVSFPNTPVGVISGYQLIYFYNTGTAPITVDRVVTSGPFSIYETNCEATTVAGIAVDGTSASSCYVYVQFTPTATGAQTGTLTFTDSAPGSPHVVNLTGSGITATGTISLNPTSLSFSTQPDGTTATAQYIYFVNPGNSSVNVTAFTFSGTNAADYSVSSGNCSPPVTVSAGQSYCYVYIQFTPGATGTRTATFTVASSAGNFTASLTGTGVAASQAIGLTPTSMSLGSIVVSSSGANEYVYIRNTGTEPVTFSANPTVTGTNASDFTTTNNCAYSGYSLPAGTSCYIYVQFTPGGAGARSATLTFTDSAGTGTQTLALSGTGVSATPTYSLSDYLISYNTQVSGTTSALSNYLYFYNNGTASVTLGNIGITGAFVLPAGYNTCNGQTITAGSSCYAYVEFAPTAAGYATGTLTFNNSGGTALSGVPVVPLAGFAVAPTYTSYITPTSLNFTAQQVIGTTAPSQQVTLYNTGNTSLTLGTVAGTDFGSTSEFSVTATGGYDGCSGQTVTAGSYCYVYVVFTPSTAGARTGTISFPVTYANSTTATLTGNLSGTGVAEVDASVLTPPNASFIDEVVGTTESSSAIYLNNNGNRPFTVGTLTNTNSAEFSTSANGGADTCSGATVAVASSCYIYVAFTPSTTGAQTGTITFPVTYADKATASPKLTMTGTGVASSKTVTISPASVQFPAEIEANTSGVQSVVVRNTGNVGVTIGTDSISTNSAEFEISYDSCTGATLNPTATCTIQVTFTPTSSATGTQTGTLKIGDNATGGPHSVALTGSAITASSQIVLSQTTLAFGNQPAGSTSSAQVVYYTNQGSTSSVAITSFTLAGTNPTDFSIVTNTCGSSIAAQSNCYVSIQFTPLTSTSGALSATYKEIDAVGTHTITLTGTAVAAGAAVAFSPSTLSFSTQNVGTTSAAQNFSVTNTGSANLTITAVASTNATEFPVYTDSCSGLTLTPGQNCLISVKFSPSLGGARTGTIKVTDNATGSPQSVAVTGTGYGIPATSFTPTSLTFASTNIGVTSATQTITLKDTGTDTLDISSIAVTGVNLGDFAQTNTCVATLAPAATCVITVSFTPTAAGARGASVTVTDNSNNVAGSTQSAALTGTGAAVPTAGVAPTTLTFSSTNVGATSAAQTVTITNSGTGSLTISSITIGGTSSADYAETNTCGATLVASSSCAISVTFKPVASGTLTASITITDNAGNVAGTTQTVSLTGTAVGLPGASVSPSSLTFTNQNIASTSAAQTITLSNSGSSALTIASIAIGGTNPGDFATTNTCAGSVAAAGSCSISVTFTPTAIGSRSATLTVTDNSGNVTGSTQTVSLIGTGVGVPAASPSPTSLTFSAQNVGTTSTAKTVTLTNSGTGALTISSIAITGTNEGDFATTNNCAGTVAASGGSCTISVTFTPAAAGTRSATLTINDNAANTASSQTVALSGTGTGVSSAAVSPSTVAFGNQNVGSTSASQTITLSNSGSAALTIASIAIGGTNASYFSTTNNCAGSVALNSSCSIAVTFTPAATGSATATLTVTDNANNTSGSTQTMSLTGTGVGVASAAVAPSTVVFPSQNVATTSTAQTIALSNSGTATLTVTNIAISGTNASDFAATNNCAGSVAAGSNCSISVTFTPGAAGSRSGVLTVTDNAGNTAGSTQMVVLTGTGNGVPTAGVAPSSISFPTTGVGATSAAQTVTLSNTGTGPLTISNIVIGGENPGNFAETTTCGSSLAVSANCSISVTFTPSAAVSYTANLHILDNSGNAGATQTVTLSGTGGTASTVSVPNVVGDTQAAATSAIQSAGLVVGTVTSASSSSVPSGDVISESPAAGTSVSSGSAVNLVVSSGPATDTVPNVVGDTQSAATSAIQSAGLVVGTVTTASSSSVPSGDVISESPAAGTSVSSGSAVNLVVSSGPVTPAATYTGLDTTTLGTWTGKYGSNGYNIANDTTNTIPSYATLSLAGDTPYTWSSTTTSTSALQVSSSSSSRIASAYYSATSFNINLNLTDGNTHQISLYLLDDENGGTARAETISILNASNNAVLSTQTFSSFTNGEYAIWSITGNVIIQVTKTAGANAVVSGIFFDPPPPVTVPNVVGDTQATATSAIQSAGLVVGTVTMATSSTVASGDVISESPAAGTSVADGSAVNLVVSSGPGTVAVPNVVGDTQAAATSAIQSAGLVVGTVTTASSSSVPSGDVISESPAAGTTVADGSAVNLVVSSGPATTPVPNVVGDTQSAATSAIQSAGLVVGTVTTATSTSVPSGDVISENPAAGTTVADGSAVNLVVSSGTGNAATYTGLDTTTQGTWTNVYGSNGYNIANDTTNTIPSYATLSLAGDTPYTWSSTTTAASALQVSSGSSSRIASAYYSATSFNINLDLTDGNTHKISLYLLDDQNGGTGRAETISILDAATNAVLSTQTFSGFTNGEYAIWNITGDVIIQVTKTAGPNGVVSGIFFN